MTPYEYWYNVASNLIIHTENWTTDELAQYLYDEWYNMRFSVDKHHEGN